MRTGQTKKLKLKSTKVGIKQIKAKLPQYKAKKKDVQEKKNSLKCLRMNLSSCTKTKGSQKVASPLRPSILHEKQFALQCSLKRKKKKMHKPKNTDKKTDGEIKHSVDLSLVQDIDSRETQQSGDDSDDGLCDDGPKERKNLGIPVIVDANSECLDAPGTPEALKRHGVSENETETYDEVVAYKNDTTSSKEEACILVAGSLNPSGSPCPDQRRKDKAQKPAASKKNGTRRKAEGKSLQGRNANVSTSSLIREDDENNACVDHPREADTTLVAEGEANSPRKNKSFRWTFDKNSPRLYSVRNKVLVVMEERTKFCFAGKLRIKVIYGAIEVYGTTITMEHEKTEVYSPRGYSSVAIETSEKSSNYTVPYVWPYLYPEGINQDNEDSLVADVNRLRPGMAVILLSNFENKLTRFLHVFYPFRLFPRVKNASYYSWTDPRRAEVILQSNLYFGNNNCQSLVIDRRMAHDVSETMLKRWRANEWSCTLIAGGKGVGKSTATRYLINNILPLSKMVVLVDVDPGQTECTPPGCISYSLIEQPLMGPNFTHLKNPVYQLYIGDVNVTRCLTRYIEGIKMMVERLTSCPILSRLPIVVNTMGFTYGIGWDIAVYTIKLIRPSLVVQITSQKPKNNYKEFLSSEIVNQEKFAWTTWSANVVDWNVPCNHELRVVRSHAETKNVQRNEAWNMEPYQQRELVMISYLSDIVQCPENSTSYYNGLSLSINNAVPYVAPFSSLSISIPRACVPPSHALSVINGNIVALCGVDLTCDDFRETENSTSGPRVLTRSPLCTCYGFGIVRGIDMEREEVFINTPLSASMMQHVNCLVGCIPVPVTLLQLNRQRNVPYTGGSDDLPTSREPRRGYFRMRYQNTQANP